MSSNPSSSISAGMDDSQTPSKDNVVITSERPYRSHLQPACLECRKRKSRCKSASNADKCFLCLKRNTECYFPRSEQHAIRKTTSSTGARRRSQDQNTHNLHELQQPSPGGGAVRVRRQHEPPHDRVQTDTAGGLDHARESSHHSIEDPMGILSEAQDESPHVVGPVLLDDNDDLEDYLYEGSERSKRIIRPSSGTRHPDRRTWPIAFTTVRRSPMGLVTNQSSAAFKCEIIEKLIEPHAQDLINLFFERANPCFPVFNKSSFLKIYSSMKRKISPALLSNLYANALVYWHTSTKLAGKQCPDVQFIWFQANEALNIESFQSPGLSTILAMILNIGGRPSTSIFGNAALIGTAVTRANALGLNRDPSDWQISESERLFRIKVWWLLVLQDRWSSLTYGIPLQINRRQFDVPIPTEQQIQRVDKLSDEAKEVPVFIGLITLTEILGQILEFVYDVTSPALDGPNHCTKLVQSLTDWENSQSHELHHTIFQGNRLKEPGAANFRLAYLSVKLLLRRLQLSLARKYNPNRSEALHVYHTQAQSVAEEILQFVQGLDERHIRGFWLPMHSYSLTSVTAFLLRSPGNENDADHLLRLQTVKSIMGTLRHLRQRYSWDLADNCIATYGKVVDQLDTTPVLFEPMIVNSPAPPDDGISEFGGLFTSLEDYLQADFENWLQS